MIFERWDSYLQCLTAPLLSKFVNHSLIHIGFSFFSLLSDLCGTLLANHDLGILLHSNCIPFYLRSKNISVWALAYLAHVLCMSQL